MEEATESNPSTPTLLPLYPNTILPSARKDDQTYNLELYNFNSTDDDKSQEKHQETDLQKMEKRVIKLESDLKYHTTLNNKMRKKYKALEEKSDKYMFHPHHDSSDSNERSKICKKEEELFAKMETMEINMDKQKCEMDKTSKAKDTAFHMIRDIKVEIATIAEDINSHDIAILSNRNNVATLRQSMTEQKKENRQILSKL